MDSLDDDRDIRVFLSYAHENKEFQDNVRNLWLLLRDMGIDAQLDLPAAEEPRDWSVWMMDQVREADFVLVMASPQYRLRAEQRVEPHVGRGVQHEAGLIRDAFYGDQPAGRRRFLPVILPGCSEKDIPTFLGQTVTSNYRISEITEKGVEKLYRVLTDQPWEVAPALGDRRSLPSRPTERAASSPRPPAAS